MRIVTQGHAVATLAVIIMVIAISAMLGACATKPPPCAVAPEYQASWCENETGMRTKGEFKQRRVVRPEPPVEPPVDPEPPKYPEKPCDSCGHDTSRGMDQSKSGHKSYK